jgi:hypothetical protein
VRLDSAAGSGQRIIVAQDGTRTSPFLLSYSVADKKWRFAVAGTDVDAPATAAVLSNQTVVTGVWTRLFATYDGTSHALKLYVNGALQTATATSTTFDATGPVTVGRGMAAGAPTGFLPGAIDDVRVYGRTVLATEHEFALVGLPNPPIVTTPGGTTTYVSKTLQAVLSAGGDTAVTKIQYQMGVSGTVTTVTLPAAGGQTTVNVTSTQVGTADLMVQGIDTAGNKSPIAAVPLEFGEAPALSGKVVDAITSTPISGAKVTLSPGDTTVTTGSTGTYSFTGINAGTFDVTALYGGVGCAGQIATTEVDVDRAVVIDLNLAPESDVFGYTCRTKAGTAFVPAPTKANLTFANESTSELPLPFTVPYYGKNYNTYRIDQNGWMAFGPKTGGPEPWWSQSLPDRDEAPRGAVIPFLTDMDSPQEDSQSSIWTGVVGSGASQRFVVEWRNTLLRFSTGPRISFEVLVAPNGDITFNYSGVADDPTRGNSATVGITSPGGNYALEYSTDEPTLVSGTAITFAYPTDPTPIPYGTLSGTVSHDGEPLAGLKVGGAGQTVTTDESGHYEIDDIESGIYGVDAHSGCDGNRTTDLWIEGDTMVDLPLSTYVDAYGYYCELEDNAQWVPGTTLLPDPPVDEDGEDLPYPLPFAFPFYGKTYSKADMSPWYFYIRDDGDYVSGGDIEFVPGIPWEGDADTVYTATVGTAPNRQFVLEARDLVVADHPDIKFSEEMVFGEDGTLRLLIKGPSELYDVTDFPVKFWFYSLDYGEIDYFEDGRGYPLGKSVVVHPPAAS